jgi:hypothetical protein
MPAKSDLLPPPVALSQVGRAAHDVGLAGLLGGNLYGRVALHPSVTEISDPAERGRVVNAAWRRYGFVNLLSLAAVAVGWLGARADEAANRRLSPRERRLASARDMLLGAVAATGLAAAIEGIRFARMAPGGAIPLIDGDTAGPGATERQARTKRILNALGLVTLASEAALVGVNAAFAQENYRRPPARRLVVWRLRR